ncbi:hypothetical protein PUN28_004012 [Cardiocondyla obscurior]|uniref:Uncharacterized protein n=1 Tax=Cardiocondyla obscurior TaxID=286306 RepID=A0AAW2GNM1_9HYME
MQSSVRALFYTISEHIKTCNRIIPFARICEGSQESQASRYQLQYNKITEATTQNAESNQKKIMDASEKYLYFFLYFFFVLTEE